VTFCIVICDAYQVSYYFYTIHHFMYTNLIVQGSLTADLHTCDTEIKIVWYKYNFVNNGIGLLAVQCDGWGDVFGNSFGSELVEAIKQLFVITTFVALCSWICLLRYVCVSMRRSGLPPLFVLSKLWLQLPFHNFNCHVIISWWINQTLLIC